MKTEICISIIAKTAEEAIKGLREAEALADITELRIDFIKGINAEKLKRILENKTKKAIVACRTKECNGNYNGTSNERIKLLKSAMELADFVDIEFETDSDAINSIIKNRDMINNSTKKNTKIIVSYHNFNETLQLEKLDEIYKKIMKLNADFVKIVTNANSINDNFTIFKLLRNKSNLIAFCMGLRGHISRILAPKYGSCLTYASLREKMESAPGQLAAKELIEVYNFYRINQKTKVVGVVGEFAENSMSKHMHNSSFRKNNLNFVYMPFKAREEELGDFIKNFMEFNFSGSSVTVPYKVLIMDFIEEIDKTAKDIGAVNTLVNKNGIIKGYNTDYYGAINAVKEKINPKGKKILVIGAGGASRAVVYSLANENAAITITNRSMDKAKELAKEFNAKAADTKSLKQLMRENDIIINTTSVGMQPNAGQSIAKENDFAQGKIVMDIVYKPVFTKFIEFAKKMGCETITGDRMLIYQAIAQYKLWTGQDADFKTMESALEKETKR